LTNLLANGLSSSPSNSPAPIDRGRFPKVTIHDNVRLQHKLITEKLGIERLRLVTGFSMGACQTFQWAAQFPDMVRAACPIAGSARTGNFNKVFLLALRRTLELDPVYAEGFYDRPPVKGIKAFATIYAGWGTSEPFFREEAFRPLGSRSTQEHVADFWEPFFLRCDANNLLSQLWTWEAGDISANPTYGGDFEAALGAIKARTIIVPVDNDRYFPPVDSRNEARHIPGAKVSVVASAWGHMALMNPADIPAIDAPLNELLAG
jgi:homoserine O-acetyltransferase